jgi:hypothetical protein
MRRLWVKTEPFWGDSVEDGIGGAISLAQHLHCGVSLSVNGVTIGVLPDDTIELALDLYHRLAGISPRVTPGKKR